MHSFFSATLASIALLSISINGSPVVEQGLAPLLECTLPARPFFSTGAGELCITIAQDSTANYTVQSGDSCNSIAQKFNNFTSTQLVKWNPYVGRQCYGLRAYVPVVINAPGYTYKGQPANGDFMDASLEPSPTMSGVTNSCRKFEYVALGLSDTQVNDLLLVKNGLSKETFLSWNPSNKHEKDGDLFAWGGYWVCVGV